MCNTSNLLLQDYCKVRLVSTIKKFCGRHHDLVDSYNVAVSKLIADLGGLAGFSFSPTFSTDT